MNFDPEAYKRQVIFEHDLEIADITKKIILAKENDERFLGTPVGLPHDEVKRLQRKLESAQWLRQQALNW